jgi:hypothetical protein
MIMASDKFTNKMYYLFLFHCFDALHGMISEKRYNDKVVSGLKDSIILYLKN